MKFTILPIGATEEQARAWVKEMVFEHRLNFHPDTPGRDYIDKDGSRCFNDMEATLFDSCVSGLFAACDPYKIGSEVLEGWQRREERAPTYQIRKQLKLLGFEEHHTGGGCMALRLALPNGGQVLITNSDGMGLPIDGEKALVGVDDANGNEIICGETFK